VWFSLARSVSRISAIVKPASEGAIDMTGFLLEIVLERGIVSSWNPWIVWNFDRIPTMPQYG